MRQRSTRCPSTPIIVSAATIALTIASSVAYAVASKIGLIPSFDSICSEARPLALQASGLAVEKAMKMSPEPLPDDAAGAGRCRAWRGAPGA